MLADFGREQGACGRKCLRLGKTGDRLATQPQASGDLPLGDPLLIEHAYVFIPGVAIRPAKVPVFLGSVQADWAQARLRGHPTVALCWFRLRRWRVKGGGQFLRMSACFKRNGMRSDSSGCSGKTDCLRSSSFWRASRRFFRR